MKRTSAIYCKSASNNKKWNVPVGTWDTGTPPSIAALMIAKEQIKNAGSLPPELCVELEVFFKKLEKRE